MIHVNTEQPIYSVIVSLHWSLKSFYSGLALSKVKFVDKDEILYAEHVSNLTSIVS